MLWDGPLGNTLGGTHPDLIEKATVVAYKSKTHFVRSMRTAKVNLCELINKKPSHLPIYKPFSNPIQYRLKQQRLPGNWFLKRGSIGEATEPKCGQWSCGNCHPWGKEMTLAEEREVEMVKNGLSYVTGHHLITLARQVSMEPTCLLNNRKAVEAPRNSKLLLLC